MPPGNDELAKLDWWRWWFVLTATAVVSIFSLGSIFSVSVFIDPIRETQPTFDRFRFRLFYFAFGPFGISATLPVAVARFLPLAVAQPLEIETKRNNPQNATICHIFDASSDVVTRALSIQGGLGGVVPIWIGADLASRGARFYSLLGLCTLAVGTELAAWSLAVQSQVVYYLSAGVVQGIGYGVMYIAVLQHLMQWFPDRPGR